MARTPGGAVSPPEGKQGADAPVFGGAQRVEVRLFQPAAQERGNEIPEPFGRGAAWIRDVDFRLPWPARQGECPLIGPGRVYPDRCVPGHETAVGMQPASGTTRGRGGPHRLPDRVSEDKMLPSLPTRADNTLLP